MQQHVDWTRARPHRRRFGTLKRSYGMARMRFMGLARNAAATLLILAAWKLARAAARAN